MAVDFQITRYEPRASIKVMGIGGCGGNIITYMIEQGLQGAEFIAANTDLQALSMCKATKTIQLGERTAGGLGVGCNADKGRKAVEESIDEIQRELENIDMLFLTGGLGGGTGTGGLPVVAQLAKQMNILTVAVVTKPFSMEGSLKMKVASEGLKLLEETADSIIVIPNQKILELDKKMPFKKARTLADEILFRAVKGIVDIIQYAGVTNIDMEDVKNVMRNSGRALMGMGYAAGENKAETAVHQAIYNPLVEIDSIDGCTGALINISANPEELINEDVEVIVNSVSNNAVDEALVKFGIVERPDFNDEISVTVIATGFDGHRNQMKDGIYRTASSTGKSQVMEERQSSTSVTQRFKRMTDAGQIHLPVGNDTGELKLSEDVTSIPAFISHLQKMKK